MNKDDLPLATGWSIGTSTTGQLVPVSDSAYEIGKIHHIYTAPEVWYLIAVLGISLILIILSVLALNKRVCRLESDLINLDKRTHG